MSLVSMIMIMVLERMENFLLHCQIYHNGTKDRHVATRLSHGYLLESW